MRSIETIRTIVDVDGLRRLNGKEAAIIRL